MTAAADPFRDVHWFPDTLNADAGQIEFVHTDRDALAAAPFLDPRFSSQLTRRVRAPLTDLAMTGSGGPPAHFIFHTAFCCSTLLARALDHPGTNLSLKEPNVLMDLANAKRVSARIRNRPGAWNELSASVLSLLSRRFETNESVLVKPTNPANNLIPDVLASGSHALLLYSDLKSFLVSVIKKGEGCRAFVRELLNIFRLDPEPLGAIPDRQALKFTDLQVAAMVWRHQMEGFMKAVHGPYGGNVRTLDCSVLLADPAATLFALNDFFSLGLAGATIRTTAAGPVFAVNAKFANRDYSADQRAAEAADIEAQYGEALETILGWAQSLRLDVDVPAVIPRALEVARSAAPQATG